MVSAPCKRVQVALTFWCDAKHAEEFKRSVSIFRRWFYLLRRRKKKMHRKGVKLRISQTHGYEFERFWSRWNGAEVRKVCLFWWIICNVMKPVQWFRKRAEDTWYTSMWITTHTLQEDANGINVMMRKETCRELKRSVSFCGLGNISEKKNVFKSYTSMCKYIYT